MHTLCEHYNIFQLINFDVSLPELYRLETVENSIQRISNTTDVVGDFEEILDAIRQLITEFRNCIQNEQGSVIAFAYHIC